MENSEDETSMKSEASVSSIAWSEGQVVQRFGLTLRRTSEQRLQSKHSRYLPSRAIAILGKASTANLNIIKPYNALDSTDNSLSPSQIDNAETIANQMEMQEELMQNDPLSELKRLETLRDMPQCLTVKRSIRAKLTASVNMKTEKSLSRWKRIKYSYSILFMKMIIAIKEVSSTMELWYSAIKSIEGHFGSGVATYFKFLRWLLILNIINSVISILFIVLPQSLFETYKDSNFNIWNIFLGNGFMEETIFYYGFYTNTTITKIPEHHYNIPSAYFLTMLFCYTFTFILLSMKVAKSYRKCYIETSGGIHNLYATKIFCGWDYSIASSKAAHRCHQSIYRELKELLAETIEQKTSSFLKRLFKIFVQIFMTLIVLCTMGCTSWLLWYLLMSHKSDNTDNTSLLIVPLVITGIMNIFPVIISQLVKLERYNSKRKSLYVNMIRIYTMTVVIIATLLVYWLTYSMYNCWQTSLAQEIYRLMIFDFLIFTIGSFLMESLRFYLHKCWDKITAPKFDIALNTLNLIYNQILFWVAFYFSPPLSLLIVIKMFLTFYIKKFGLMRHCEQSSIPWRAAQTQTLFLALGFLGITGSIATLGYVITRVRSSGCGPFREHDYTWLAVIEEVLNLKRDSQLWTFITNIARPGVGAAILIAMGMTLYCLRAKAQANIEMVHILREMLVLQSRDKDFLLNEFSKVADEDWLRRRTAFNETRSSMISPRHSACLNQKISPDKRDNQEPDVSLPSCSKNYVTFDNA